MKSVFINNLVSDMKLQGFYLCIQKRIRRKRDGSPIHRSRTDKQKEWDVRLYYIDENHIGHYHPPKGFVKLK